MPDAALLAPKQPFAETFKYLPIAFVWGNIVILYFIYIFYHVSPLLQDPATFEEGVIKSIIFNIITLLSVICYVRCMMTDPGSIPESHEDPSWSYKEIPDDSDLIAQLVEKKSKDGQRRHCKWCTKYKPDRCHHCRVCQRCILRMDHHCPWIYNCVGFRNHKYFFLLIFYTSIACNMIVWTMLPTVKHATDPGTPFSKMFILLFGETLAAVLGFLLTLFFLFHVALMFSAMTTIEWCEKASKRSADTTNYYDRGICGNLRAVLGDNELLWLLPVSPPSGNGLHFINEEVVPLQRSDIETARGLRPKFVVGDGGHSASAMITGSAAVGYSATNFAAQKRRARIGNRHAGGGTGAAPESEGEFDFESGHGGSEKILFQQMPDKCC